MIAEQKPTSVSDLKRLFEESKTQLGDHLADTRTNNNLFQGNHFQKRNAKISRHLEGNGTSEDIKIRITKNHINTVCKYIINSILHGAPTGVIGPKNPSELQDQKSAEIHKMVFEDYKYQNKLNAQIRSWVHDYVVSGEVFLNVFWDDNMGLKIRPPVQYDLNGMPVQGEPFFEGDVECDRIYPWDVRQDPGAKTFATCKWIGYEKMVDKDAIKKLAPDHADLDQALKDDLDETYKVFEASTGTYKEAKGKVLLRQIYYRPCSEYPNGKFVFFTKDIILIEGELPVDQNGNVFFPIKYVGFDEIPTSARSSSVIKQVRSEQMEINRCASAIAHTQMTVGYDKLIVPTGGEVEAGATKAGVRIFKVPGGKQSSDFIQGRSGDQFLGTLQQNITELYNKLGVPENWDEKSPDTDMMAMLYKNMRQKTRFSLYSEKFSEFLIDVIITILKLKKAYMRDETFFRVTGKSEYQNIAEFRSLDDLGYQVKVEAGTEDLESKFGRFMSLTNILQYVGTNMDDNTKGMILRNLPFANGEEITSKLTMQYDNAKNIMLALDRGEATDLMQTGDPLYFAEQLENRKNKPDYRYLNQNIKSLYEQHIQAYQQMYADKAKQVQLAQSGFIPADGPTVPVDGMYETTMGPDGVQKTKRVQLPQASLVWLGEKLKSQGSVLGNIQSLDLSQQASIANQYMEGMSPSTNQMVAP
jgi:hypothetical protein